MGGFSIHHYVRPQNMKELKVKQALKECIIHTDARPSAVFYVSTILGLYLLGLLVILVHYMNSCYGAWNWSAGDVWREIRPRKMGGKKSPQQASEEDPHHHEGCPMHYKARPPVITDRRISTAITLATSSKKRNLREESVETGEASPLSPNSPISPLNDNDLSKRNEQDEEELVEEELRRIWTRSRKSIIRKWSSIRGKRPQRDSYLCASNNNTSSGHNNHANTNTNTGNSSHSGNNSTSQFSVITANSKSSFRENSNSKSKAASCTCGGKNQNSNVSTEKSVKKAAENENTTKVEVHNELDGNIV